MCDYSKPWVVTVAKPEIFEFAMMKLRRNYVIESLPLILW